ncbi:head maturation protease, ClpP-related [Priestia aryabhattai]|uniref:head maturation protease, ClpP-related n=1 Tax=Priestia aryabhattai TaxID=412384 RepID=UPI003C8C2D89
MKMSANSDNVADIYIYGDIVTYSWYEEDTSATTFKNDLDALGEVDTINLYINSPGGSVFEGVAIHNMLKRHNAKVNVHVDALAASIASVIAMAGDAIFMPKNSMLMIHNPWTWGMGNAADFRKLADDLDRIGNSAKQTYLAKAGDKLTEDRLQELLDGETWLSADEACELGLCDVVEEANTMAASISSEILQKYKHVPQNLVNQQTTISASEMAERQRIAEQAKVNSSYLNDILGGVI